MLDISLPFRKERRVEKVREDSQRAGRRMCLFSGENNSPPFCWAGGKRSGFLFDSTAETVRLVSEDLNSRRGESGFFRTVC